MSNRGRFDGCKKLLCEMLDCIYETTLIDTTDEKTEYWQDMKQNLVEKLAKGHNISYKQLYRN